MYCRSRSISNDTRGELSTFYIKRNIYSLVLVMRHQETQTLFHAYIGGLYRDSGALEQVQQWLENLISDNTPIHSTRATAETSTPTSMNTGEPQTSAGPPPYVNNAPNRPPPQKKIKSDPVAVFCAAQPGPSVPSMPFPPPTVYPSGYNQTQYNTFANPLTPAQPNLAFLPLFNQTASQRRVKVEYPSDFMGPSHAGKWTVRCCGEPCVYSVAVLSLTCSLLYSQWHHQGSWYWRLEAGC